MSLETIELMTKEHAAHRTLLAERVRILQDLLERMKRRKLQGIRNALSQAKDSQLRLHAAIDAERTLFVKPRTRVFHGIKVGLQKAKGKLTFEDAAQVVKLVRKHFADQFDVLVRTKETPVKDALLLLPVVDLKRIGCSVSESGDEVFIKPADSEIDKLVDALLKDKNEDMEGEE